MTFHLGGGEGGMAHMLAQFRPVFEGWWASMGTPELTDELCRRIIDGVRDEAGGRTIEELAAERDEKLVAIMRTIASRSEL